MTQHFHYVKMVRDAAPILDSILHRLVEEDSAFAIHGTNFTFADLAVRMEPEAKHREAVFTIAAEEFNKAGWHFSSRLAPESEDPARSVISMTFKHPSTQTRLGRAEDAPSRPWAMSFEVPMPDPNVPITPDLIDFYAKQASDITRGLMAQQVVKEEFKMPGTPGQGVDNPHFRPPMREGFPPPPKPRNARPLNEVFGTDPDDADDNSA